MSSSHEESLSRFCVNLPSSLPRQAYREVNPRVRLLACGKKHVLVLGGRTHHHLPIHTLSEIYDRHFIAASPVSRGGVLSWVFPRSSPSSPSRFFYHKHKMPLLFAENIKHRSYSFPVSRRHAHMHAYIHMLFVFYYLFLWTTAVVTLMMTCGGCVL